MEKFWRESQKALVMKGIYTKFSDLWDGKVNKNMHQRIIAQDNIYMILQFAYVYGLSLIKNSIKNSSTFILGWVIIWIKHK